MRPARLVPYDPRALRRSTSGDINMNQPSPGITGIRLTVCKDVAKKMLASIFDGDSNPHIGKTLKKRMSVNSVFRRTSGCLQIRQRGSNCIDFIFSFSILNLFGLLVQIKSTVLRLAKPHKYRAYKKHHLSTTTRGP